MAPVAGQHPRQAHPQDVNGGAHIRVDGGVDILRPGLVKLSETAPQAGIIDDDVGVEVADDFGDPRRIAHVQHVAHAAGFLGQRLEALLPPCQRVYR